MEVRALTSIPSNQSPKSFLDFLKESLGGKYIEHNLVVFPEYLHQPQNKGRRPVLALWGSYQRSRLALNNYPSCSIKPDMTQVACSLFVHLAFNFDWFGFSLSRFSQRSSALLKHWGGADIALQFLVIGSSIKEVGYPILYHFNLVLGVFSYLFPNVIH